MYDNIDKKNCEGCGAEFEYYTFAMKPPTHCRDCQIKAAVGTRKRTVKKVKPPKEKVIEVPKEEIKEVPKEEVPKKLSEEMEALIKYGSIPGVSSKLIMKYGNIKKITEVLSKKG